MDVLRRVIRARVVKRTALPTLSDSDIDPLSSIFRHPIEWGKLYVESDILMD